MPLDTLSAEKFNECLNQTFRIRAGEETVEAELVEVSGITSHTRREDKKAFSVLFQGPMNKPIEQGIYRLENDTMGELDLFLVTLGPDAGDNGMIYEAVFT